MNSCKELSVLGITIGNSADLVKNTQKLEFEGLSLLI